MNHNGIIAGEGIPFILALAGAAALAYLAGFRGFSILFAVLTLFVTWFFRNPKRVAPEGKGLVISPADGKVIRIEEAESDQEPGKTFRKISIFMNVFNVHVNRIPCSGKVVAIRYREGKFISANLDKASEQNERNTVVLQTDDGPEIMTVQIAGLIARRIVCWVKEGVHLQRGERFGLIRFGSRVEVFLPPGSTVLVKIGDKVRAGETPIGELP
jgi:phosphatidylserine decarboxylase